jgi:archaellum biogenesis protein FlaJ (TadC family)
VKGFYRWNAVLALSEVNHRLYKAPRKIPRGNLGQVKKTSYRAYKRLKKGFL